jgi:NAD(P)-dependent dehydrogenase (short-subunit alcohol dehydrogenase family)
MYNLIYGGNSFIGRSLIDDSKGLSGVRQLVSIGSTDCDYTYDEFYASNWDLVTGIVYSTGRAQPPNTSLDANPELFDKNCFEFFHLMEFLEPMLSKNCSIVYISSGHAHRASPDNSYYAASKAASDSFVVSQSLKFARLNRDDEGTRRINSIAPEGISSPMIDNILEKGIINRVNYIATRPNFRLLHINEVLSPIKFLLNGGSTGINGQIITIGGVK